MGETAVWVKNPYKKTYVLEWGGHRYVLKSGEVNLLPTFVVRAFFPDLETIEKFVPQDEPRRTLETRALMEIYKGRWGLYDMPYDKFIDFISGFIIANTKEEIEEIEKELLSKIKSS